MQRGAAMPRLLEALTMGWRRLAVAEGDPAPRQIVGGELDGDAVPGEDADVVLAHFAAEIAEHLMLVFELDGEHRVR